MNDRQPTADDRVDRLESRLERVEARLAAIERHLAERGLGADPPVEEPLAAPAPPVPAHVGWPDGLALVGRTLIVLGGAFALRAVTEAGLVPQLAGTGLALLYAVVWLVLADRAAGAGRRASAGFHALAAAAIVYPLLGEATVRFGFLTPTAAVLALGATAGAALGVAARRRLRAMAWVHTLAAVATAFGLAIGTKQLVSFVALVLLLGLATILLAYGRGWRGLARFVAAAVDLAVLLLTVILLVGAEGGRVTEIVSPLALVALQLALVAVYLGTCYARTLFWNEQIAAEAMVQAVAVIAIGLGGAIVVTESVLPTDLPLGLGALALALASYAASFTFIDRALERRRSFIFYTSTALVFTLVGLGLTFSGQLCAVAFAVAGLVAAWLGSLLHRATLSLHGSVYIVAGAVSVGLFGAVAEAFSGPDLATQALLSPAAWAVLLAAALAGGFEVAAHGKTWGSLSWLPKLLVLLVLAPGVGAVVVTVLAALVPVGADGRAEPAALATLRTGVLALSAIGVALAGRWPRLHEAAWLVYPILVAGGLKLILEDLRTGRPLTLFLSLALYGGALILAPRLAR